MTTPHDDELRSDLLDAPDHRPDFWAALDTDLAAEEREDMAPLGPPPRPPSWPRPTGGGGGPGGVGWHRRLVRPQRRSRRKGCGGRPGAHGDHGVGRDDSAHDCRWGVTDTGVQSVTAMVERTSVSGLSGTFSLVADEDGTIIVRGDDPSWAGTRPRGRRGASKERLGERDRPDQRCARTSSRC